LTIFFFGKTTAYVTVSTRAANTCQKSQ